MLKIASELRVKGEFLYAPERVKRIRDLIRRNNDELSKAFRAGASVLDLIKVRADFIDDLLITCWQHFLGPYAQQLALAAVGGYGRRELHPHSDIDILILLDDSEHERYQKELESFFTFLWDVGLKPGQSVRTVEECVAQAIHDQTVITNLMESRLIYGNQALFDSMKSQTAPDKIWPSREFFEAKMAEQLARYAKYHDTAYNLEPNIKEGPGGLRDIQNIAWVIKRHFNSSTLYELVAQGILTESEYHELMNAQKYLWKLRFALHILTNRCEDRLLFDYQKALAEQFGFQNQGKENQAVEAFMQQYYRTVMGLERLNEMLLQLLREMLLEEFNGCQPIPINDHFQSSNHHIEVRYPDVFRQHPWGLLEIFLILQKNRELKGIRAPTIRLIRQNLYLIDNRFRHDKRACVLFMEILRQSCGITHQLRRMNRYGVLAAYLPEFAHVVGRMQYDLFHVYTVDEHSLFVVRNLRRFSLDIHQHEFPLCHDVFKLIPKPELLYIAGLYHDIAKGKGGDHSIIGETMAWSFCQRHALNEGDAALVAWLVRHHLIMSMTSQRKDIEDPEVVHEFAELVGDEERLDYLYLLTVADIRATNPNLWNSWKDVLLKELYLATRQAFQRGLENPLDQQDKAFHTRQEAKGLLNRLGLKDEIINQVWRSLNDDYFLRYGAEESAWHTLAIASCKEEDLPLVLLRPQNYRGGAEVFLYMKNEDYIFSHSTAVLDQLGLTILDARIFTSSDGYALNSYLVLEQSGEPIRDLSREQQICSKLRKAMKHPSEACLKVVRREDRHIKHFPIKTQVSYHSDPQNRYTLLELVATDRPGLLSKVGQAFNCLHIRLHNAKVTTIGSRAEDTFYITDQQNNPLHSPHLKKALRRAIIERVGEH